MRPRFRKIITCSYDVYVYCLLEYVFNLCKNVSNILAVYFLVGTNRKSMLILNIYKISVHKTHAPVRNESLLHPSLPKESPPRIYVLILDNETHLKGC